VRPRLSLIDRFLPLWILLAIALGVALGRLFPSLGAALDTVKIAGVSLPIAVGLFSMMYPVLAKARYGQLGAVGANARVFGASLFFNWVLGPILMFALAGLFLPDLPHYRTGLVRIGLARCIAMVLIWNMLAQGSSELAALLVALAAGALTRVVLVRRRGAEWYEKHFLPRIGPTALLVLYFAIMFTAAFVISKKLGFTYAETASLSFTAAGNNFELAIAVAIGLFGISSGEALAGVVGPLIEVPALLALVYFPCG